MNDSQIALKLVLDGINQPEDVATFQQRLLIQKKVYLAQLTGLDLGYRFGWYLRGPYCRSLTSDVFLLNEQIKSGEDEYKNSALLQSTSKQLERATGIWAKSPSEIGDDDWLELLASLHFLKHIAYWPKGGKREFADVFKALIESKRQFKGRKADAKKAWEQLGRVGLLKSKVLAVA